MNWKSFLKKYWRYTERITYTGRDYFYFADGSTTMVTTGLFYKPIQKIIDTCYSIYYLRLPRYNLNDTFPLGKDGYTKITHSLLLERGRYYSDGPLLIDNVNEVKFIAKKKHDLVIHINMYQFVSHNLCILGNNVGKLIINKTILIGHNKKRN